LRDACEELRSDREFLKPIFSDDTIDTILEQEINDYNEVAVRPHPHEFSMYAMYDDDGKILLIENMENMDS
jgi:glutamine synthetase